MGLTQTKRISYNDTKIRETCRYCSACEFFGACVFAADILAAGDIGIAGGIYIWRENGDRLF